MNAFIAFTSPKLQSFVRYILPCGTSFFLPKDDWGDD